MSKQPLEFTAPLREPFTALYTAEAQAFIADLCERYRPRLQELLAARTQRQQAFDQGALPDFSPETRAIREEHWQVRDIPADLRKRRIEITGPVDRKMVINALNADVDVFMADFEDAQAPTWEGLMQGQLNLRDANAGTISLTDEARGKTYTLNPDPALLIARVRGLHLPEKHVRYRGEPVPGPIIDFALYFFHNYRLRQERNTGVYFYLPKLEHHSEAAWWADIFQDTEARFQVPTGTIRATVLIETLPAVFQMHEILHALRDYIVGLNCGRWDYIFSYIKTLRAHPDRVLPDRQQVTMDQPFLNAYSRLLIRTCHQRGALAMGGMAAFIPSKDSHENEHIAAKVRADKELEFSNGHDGTWVAHPGLTTVVWPIVERHLGSADNQLQVTREQDAPITAAELLEPCPGQRTAAGMRTNIRVALQYIAAWLSGKGCVPIYGLMEDAATAEIARTSIWQWIQHGKALDNGQTVTRQLFRQYLAEEKAVVKQEVGIQQWQQGAYEQATELLDSLATADTLTEFLTLPGYDQL